MLLIGLAGVTAIAAGVGVVVVKRRRARKAPAGLRQGATGASTVAVDPLRVLVGGAAAGGGANVQMFRPQVESAKQALREGAQPMKSGFAPTVRIDIDLANGGVKSAAGSPPISLPRPFEDM